MASTNSERWEYGLQSKRNAKAAGWLSGIQCGDRVHIAQNHSPLVQELKSNMLCGPTGAYDITLEFGEYAVIVYPGGTYPAALGTIILAADTVAGQDLPTLLQQAGWQPATPEYIQQIAQWLAEASTSASAASASELAAKVSENNAKASELAAESDRAEVAVKSANVDVKHAEVVSKAAIVDTKTAQVIAAESVARCRC